MPALARIEEIDGDEEWIIGRRCKSSGYEARAATQIETFTSTHREPPRHNEIKIHLCICGPLT